LSHKLEVGNGVPLRSITLQPLSIDPMQGIIVLRNSCTTSNVLWWWRRRNAQQG